MWVDEFVKEWERRIQASLEHEIPVRYGAATLIQVLSEKGHALAVATSTDTSRARTQLETTGLLRHFEHVIGGDLVTRHKPDPEVYHKAAAQLGYLAKDCIAFEDSEAGTRAAVAAGARTVQVPDLIAPSDKLKSLGHVIAPDLLTGAIAVGLIDTRDIT